MSAPTSVATLESDPAARAPRRVRHEPRRRELEVRRVDKIAAHMIRVTLGGDLEGFTSLGFDDHIKLFFPDGAAPAGGEPPFVSRDYTPRRYDPVAKTLDIEFVIHEAGPATRWAEQVRPGQTLRIGGPRGSFIIPTNFDWHLLIGDDTALPAIARRLAELPADTRAVVLLEVDGPGDEITFESAADVSVTLAHRNGAAAGGRMLRRHACGAGSGQPVEPSAVGMDASGSGSLAVAGGVSSCRLTVGVGSAAGLACAATGRTPPREDRRRAQPVIASGPATARCR